MFSLEQASISTLSIISLSQYGWFFQRPDNECIHNKNRLILLLDVCLTLSEDMKYDFFEMGPNIFCLWYKTPFSSGGLDQISWITDYFIVQTTFVWSSFNCMCICLSFFLMMHVYVGMETEQPVIIKQLATALNLKVCSEILQYVYCSQCIYE